MISPGLFPSFYAMKGSGRDPFRTLPRGTLPPTAYRTAKALENSPPQPTKDLRLFGWDAADAEKALEFLAETGVITDRVAISDGVAISPGKWYIHTDYC